MDKIVLKLRIAPETHQKLQRLHPAYGEMSRVAGELIEAYIRVAEGKSVEREAMYATAISGKV